MLPSGRIVDVAKTSSLFSVWGGEQPADRYRRKPIVDFEGRMASPELAILWSLEKLGWTGAWVDTDRSEFRAAHWNGPPVQLPQAPKAVVDRISALRGGKHRGMWDVFCWRDGEYLFAQCKWKNHDRFKPLQLDWFEAALGTDLPLSCFLIVEWSLLAQQAWIS